MLSVKLIQNRKKKPKYLKRLITLSSIFGILFIVGFLLYAPRIAHLNKLLVTLSEYRYEYACLEKTGDEVADAVQ